MHFIEELFPPGNDVVQIIALVKTCVITICGVHNLHKAHNNEVIFPAVFLLQLMLPNGSICVIDSYSLAYNRSIVQQVWPLWVANR